jgi:hypothetical protein
MDTSSRDTPKMKYKKQSTFAYWLLTSAQAWAQKVYYWRKRQNPPNNSKQRPKTSKDYQRTLENM